MRYLLLIIALCIHASWGWSGEGHRIIANIAEQNLTTKTKEQVDALLHQQSMADVASWADKIRGKNKTYNSWHYTTLKTARSSFHESKKTGQLYYGIQHCQMALKDPHTPIEDKTLYLKLLIHLIADAHQPLHVGNGLDKGGNYCWIQWYTRNKSYSLHKVWDDFLVKYTLKTQGDILLDSQTLREQTIAKWQHTPMKTWLRESRKLHVKLYPDKVEKDHPYCQDNQHKWIAKKYQPHLSISYSKEMAPIVKKRLLQAAFRLAYVLNQIFDPLQDQ